MIVYFDVDRFKEVNDGHGHVYGDKVLCTMGQLIKDVYGKYGACYRIGGDEFCVILEEKIENVKSLNRQFEELLDEMRKTEKNLPTISLGYSLFDPKKIKIEEALVVADENMYRMKTKLQEELKETNEKLKTMMKAFQIVAEAASSLVFIYDLKQQRILVDERTAKVYGVKEIQDGVPYETAKMGVVSEDTVEEYIRLHEEMLNGASEVTGIVKLIQNDGSQYKHRLTFRAIYDEDGKATGMAVGVYSDL